ncbi:MAG: PAS domain S-box protein [Candidatus Solibacter sp.]
MDVHEDVSYEVALRLVDLSPGPCCVFGYEGLIEYANPEALKVLSCANEQLTGRSVLDLIHPADRMLFDEALKDCSTVPKCDVEVRLQVSGGEYRQLQWTLVAAGTRIFGSARQWVPSDHDDFRQHRECLRLLEDGVKDYAIMQLDPQGKVTSWSQGAERILQYRSIEILGRDSSVLFTPEDRAGGAPGLELTLAIREGRAEDERWHVRKDGSRFLANGVMTALRGPDGELRGFVKVMRDITERRCQEDALHEAQILKSVGVLAGGIAHDFNNLLTGIIGNASLAAQDLPLGDPNRRLMEDVITAGQRAADLTQQLLAYAGKGRFSVSKVNLSAAVAEAVRATRASIPETVKLEVDLPEQLPEIKTDARQVQQIACNLLINAVEAVEGHGVIRVSTGRLKMGVEHSCEGKGHLDADEYVYYQVEDTGAGMDEQVKARIFDPFYTTKFLGRGLGLAAVSGFVRSHNGAIQLMTAPGQGSTFRILLPVAKRGELGDRPAESGLREQRVSR